MLVPLETLPGWPAAPNPSPLHWLGLLIAIPVILGVVIALASYLASTREAKRFGPPINPARAYAGSAALAGSGAGSTAIEAKPGADADTGGASARW